MGTIAVESQKVRVAEFDGQVAIGATDRRGNEALIVFPEAQLAEVIVGLLRSAYQWGATDREPRPMPMQAAVSGVAFHEIRAELGEAGRCVLVQRAGPVELRTKLDPQRLKRLIADLQDSVSALEREMVNAPAP